MDDALLEQQRQAYAVQGVDESEPAQQPKKKRKQEYINGEDVSPRQESAHVLALAKSGPRRLAVDQSLRRKLSRPLKLKNAKIPLFM